MKVQIPFYIFFDQILFTMEILLLFYNNNSILNGPQLIKINFPLKTKYFKIISQEIMKIQELSIILFIILVGQATHRQVEHTIELNTDRVGIQKQPDFWFLRFLCTSRIGSCSFEFVLLPEGWTIQGQKVKVPIGDTVKTRSYFMNVIIREPTGESVEKDIVLFFHEGNIDITARDKPVQETFVEVQIEKNSEESQNQNFKPKSKQQLTWLEENNIIAYIPTIQRLGQVINQGDIALVAILIQNIISDKSDCSEKFQYLKEVANQLEQKISENKKKLNQRNSESSHADKQIERLTLQKQKIEKELENAEKNSKEGLEKKEKQLQKERRDNYSKFTTFTIVSRKYFDKFQLYVNNPEVNAQELKRVNKQIEQDKAQIQQINKQVEELLQKKKLLEGRLNSNERKVRDSRIVGNITPQKLQSLQDNFKKFQNMAAEYKIKYEEAERQLLIVQEEVQAADGNTDFLQQRLASIDQQIQSFKSINDDDDLSVQELKIMIETLQRNAPKIEDNVDKCEKILQERNQQQQPTIIADIRPTRVIDDLEDVKIPSRSQFQPLFPILLKINVFSTDWVLQYGVPTPNSFDCTIKKNPAEGYGIITAIQKSTIRVRDISDKIYGLDLGVCSDVRAMRSNLLPQKGDIIDWQGDFIAPNIANVHEARIFRNSQ